MVGSDALIRVSLVTFPSLSGTLRSARINTRLPDNTSSDIAVIWGKFIAYVVPVSRLLARI